MDDLSLDWSIDASIDRLCYWSIDWLIDWLIHRLIDWLIDWLIDYHIALIQACLFFTVKHGQFSGWSSHHQRRLSQFRPTSHLSADLITRRVVSQPVLPLPTRKSSGALGHVWLDCALPGHDCSISERVRCLLNACLIHWLLYDRLIFFLLSTLMDNKFFFYISDFDFFFDFYIIWISDFGFWISDFGFWILDFGFWIFLCF